MSQPVTEDPACRQIRVLIVEDHLLTRLGLKSAIGLSGDIVVTGEAESGEEALQLIAEQPVDIVLLDVGLPKMDGIETARQIRSRHKDVRVVILTSHDDKKDIAACFAAGANAYCTKDIKPNRLFTAIRSVFQGDVWLDEKIADKVVRMLEESPAGLGAVERTADGNGCDILSARELEVLKLVVKGLTNQEIADQLVISLATAKAHVRSILNKLAVDDRTQAAVEAMRRGLV